MLLLGGRGGRERGLGRLEGGQDILGGGLVASLERLVGGVCWRFWCCN